MHTYRYLLIIATITAVFGALTTIGVSAVDFNISTYWHNGVEGVTIVGFENLSKGETVTIPAYIGGRPVLAIGLDGVVTTTHVPNAEKIGAFDLSDAKVEVILPYAFYGCSNITGVMQYKPGTSSAGGYSVNETEPMIISDTVEEIGDCAFFGCTALENF